jgi:Nuclease-related domain/AAA domain/UvrD-like helicase C-terminal domain
MANLHPTLSFSSTLTLGDRREQDVLQLLQDGLPPAYDLFHNLNWSTVHQGVQQIGEIDMVVVSPNGELILLEVKSGNLIESESQLSKVYAGHVKDVGRQVRKQHSVLLRKASEGYFPQTRIHTLLVLPDHTVNGDSLTYARELIVDAPKMPDLCRQIMNLESQTNLSASERQRLIDFLSERFQVIPDVATQIGQVQRSYIHLSSGMAQWVPNIHHDNQSYVIDATAGSGKTQLALKLLRDAAIKKQRARYVCFNRPLADHLAKLAPSVAEVTTFDQLCREVYEKNGKAIDFSNPQIFEEMQLHFLDERENQSQNLDLIIVDESQDMKSEWVEAIALGLNAEGKLYLMGDQNQQLYGRPAFDLNEAVTIRCMDNFRSPRKIVEMINQFELTNEVVQARSGYIGDIPKFYSFGHGAGSHAKSLEQCLNDLWDQGITPDQVAVISYQGVKNSEVLKLTKLAGYTLRKFTGQYDRAGNAIWSDGELLVESIYRFKGQSAPIVILCEIDFEVLTEKDKCKLFVGFTRAQMRLELVMSERAQTVLSASI